MALHTDEELQAALKLGMEKMAARCARAEQTLAEERDKRRALIAHLMHVLMAYDDDPASGFPGLGN